MITLKLEKANKISTMSKFYLKKVFTTIIIVFALLTPSFSQVFLDELISFNLGSSIKTEFITIDIDGDNDLDILHRNQQLNLFINTGDIVYEDAGVVYDGSQGNFDNYVVLDFDRDGLDDLLILRYDNITSEHVLSMLRSLGDGSFALEDVQSFGLIADVPELKTGDIDNDGDADLILFNTVSTTIEWIANTGAGSFETTGSTIIPAFSAFIVEFELTDMNNDGTLDLAIVDDQGNLFWFENNGSGDFGEAQVIYDQGEYLNSIYEFIDLDSDGDIDVLQAFESLSWFRNDGSSFTRVTLDNSSTINGTSLSAGDVDNDGDSDFVIQLNFSPEFRLYTNDGNGEFISSEITSELDFICRSKLIDLNDDSYKDLLVAYLDAEGLNYGIFRSGLDFPSLNGCVFLDENEDGIKNDSEITLNGIQLDLDPSSIKLQTNNDGCFAFFVEPGTYTVTPNFTDVWKLTSDSASYTVSIDDNAASDLDFGLTPTTDLLAGQMHVVSGITRCNRDTKFDFIFQNMGTTRITEGVIWGFPDELTSISNQLDPLDTLVNDLQWGWKFENLYPGQTIKRSIELSIPGLGEDVEPGTLITIFAATEAMDTQGFTNFFKYNFESEILCAYDPNDKLVRPDREGDENFTLFKDTMIYTVRFQNTGNDTAFTVVVRDTLDESLDVSTFNILGSSHREILRTEILEDKFVTFSFEDILLPDSTINFNGSQGYVVYTIESKDGVAENTIVENTASIYFDFNPPIVTNTTQNTLVECLPLQAVDVSVVIQEGESHTLPDGMVVDQAGVYTTEILDEEGCPTEIILTVLEVLTSVDGLAWNELISLSPNPSSDQFVIELDLNEAIDHSILISDVHGKEIHSRKLNSKVEEVDVQHFAPGLYYIQFRNSDGRLLVIRKFVVVR